ncbi:somatostatin receptor type 5-like [Ruditapes philippinarum]|uniref:somatostatin receptor type 5-like n=1 Tax=Ruditapes philippinarum TaxID=129788 RepID=UPI00295A5A84|nr:somatostatin receptor type 5-like [Ruditapes philippinarum]
MNNTTTDALIQADDCFQNGGGKLRIIRMTVYISVTLASYFGNILILVSLKKFSDFLKGTPYILLGNLAVADILLALGLSLQIFRIIVQPIEGEMFFCAINMCIIGISITASGFLLMFISVDRFCAIVFPMKHLIRSTKVRRRRIKLACVWFASASLICVMIFYNFIPSEYSICDHCDTAPFGIALALAVFMTLQFIMNIVMCLIVIWSLKSNTMCKEMYKKSLVKCALLIRVYIVFALCWSPYVVTIILMAVSTDKEKYAEARAYTIMPGLMNSSMNWIIYSLSNQKLRDSFRNVLLCKNSRQMHVSNYNREKKKEPDPHPVHVTTPKEENIYFLF